MDQAPFHADVADGPDGGSAHWLRTADGLRIRAAHWTGPDASATVLLFPGRTEFAEKYGRAARDLLDRGFATVAVDWRGQGLADRLLENRGIGHVDLFPDYQHDVTAVLAHARASGLPEPYYLIAHSMGGCIGLHALMKNLPVRAAMFSAPMWGILMNGALRPFAWSLSSLARRLRLDDRMAPGQETANYLARASFEENTLTNDPDMFAYLQRQVTTYPDLGLGGPSLRWLNAALIEMRDLARRPSPAYPVLTWLGGDEAIVDPARVLTRMADWPGGTLREVPGGKHEMMMDSPGMRRMIFDETAAHFRAHA